MCLTGVVRSAGTDDKLLAGLLKGDCFLRECAGDSWPFGTRASLIRTAVVIHRLRAGESGYLLTSGRTGLGELGF